MSLDQERAGSRPTLGLVEGKQSAPLTRGTTGRWSNWPKTDCVLQDLPGPAAAGRT
jgi:hypothetical protein